MGAGAVRDFLSWLASERNVSASTQNQAKSALLFRYREVLKIDLPWLGEVVAAKASRRLPVVLTSAEARRGRAAQVARIDPRPERMSTGASGVECEALPALPRQRVSLTGDLQLSPA